jgi:hypothetical protein
LGHRGAAIVTRILRQQRRELGSETGCVPHGASAFVKPTDGEKVGQVVCPGVKPALGANGGHPVLLTDVPPNVGWEERYDAM